MLVDVLTVRWLATIRITPQLYDLSGENEGEFFFITEEYKLNAQREAKLKSGPAVIAKGPSGGVPAANRDLLEPLQIIGEPEGVVDIVAWPGYIERGGTDPAYDWVTTFEQRTGCQVRVKSASTSDEMVELMNYGG